MNNRLELIHNFPDVSARMYELSRACQNNATRNALDASLIPIREAYGHLLPRGTQPPVFYSRRLGGWKVRSSRINQTPTTKVWKFPDSTGFAGFVGPRSGSAPHAHLVEAGTTFRMRLRIGGRYRHVETKISNALRGLSGSVASIQEMLAKRRTGVMFSNKGGAPHPLENAMQATQQTAGRIFQDTLLAYLVKKGV